MRALSSFESYQAAGRRRRAPLPARGRAIAYDLLARGSFGQGAVIRSASRPGERRDPYAVSSLFGIEADTLCKKRRQGLWIPAFAGTTRERSCHARRPCRARGEVSDQAILKSFQRLFM